MRAPLVWFFRRVVDIYFLSVESTGTAPAPDTRGRLFVSNHVNGLIDPILVLTAAPCPISPIAKSTLWDIPGLRWLLDAADAVPIVRRRDAPDKAEGANDAAFERVAGWLAGGGNILIFPEGVSHNAPHVLAVRSGGARMLVKAFRREPSVSYQAVALEFDARDVFRSRCLIVYGPVRQIDAHDDDEALVKTITAQIQSDLEELVVEGATWPERLLIARVAEMLAHDDGDVTLATWNEIGRQVEAARKALRDEEEHRVAEIAEAVGDYYQLLEREGLSDAQVASAGFGTTSPLRVAWLSCVLPVAVLGVLLYWLPYQAPRMVAKRAAEPDVVSTYKLGTGLVLFPLWTAGLVALAAWLLAWPWLAAAIAAIVAAPFAALTFADQSRPLRRALGSRGRRVEALRHARARAMAQIRATQAHLAAKA